MILEIAYKKHKTWLRICKSFGCNDDTCKDLVSEMYIKIDDLTKKGKDLSYGDNDINYWYCYKILRHLFLHLKIKEKRISFVSDEYLSNLKDDDYIDLDTFGKEFDKELEKLNEYDKAVFKIISSGKKISELSRETTISYVSLRNTWLKTKEYLVAKIKNYDWIRGHSRKDN